MKGKLIKVTRKKKSPPGHMSRKLVDKVAMEKKKKSSETSLENKKLMPRRGPPGPRSGRHFETFDSPKEGVQLALSKFHQLLVKQTSSSRNKVLKFMRKYHFNLFVNNTHTMLGELGHVPGVQVGDCFNSTAELHLVGLHRLPKSVDSKHVTTCGGYKVSIAISMVVSDGYDDYFDAGDFLIYSGQGGKDHRTKMQKKDWKLKGRNLALYNSQFRKNSVRVIRSWYDPRRPSKRVYSYDGLYMVVDSVLEEAKSGFKFYKFKLVKESGQPSLIWSLQKRFPYSSQTAQQGLRLPGILKVTSPGEEERGQPSQGQRPSQLNKKVRFNISGKAQAVTSTGDEEDSFLVKPRAEKEDRSDTAPDLTLPKGGDKDDDFEVSAEDGEEGGHCFDHQKIEQSKYCERLVRLGELHAKTIPYHKLPAQDTSNGEGKRLVRFGDSGVQTLPDLNLPPQDTSDGDGKKDSGDTALKKPKISRVAETYAYEGIKQEDNCDYTPSKCFDSQLSSPASITSLGQQVQEICPVVQQQEPQHVQHKPPNPSSFPVENLGAKSLTSQYGKLPPLAPPLPSGPPPQRPIVRAKRPSDKGHLQTPPPPPPLRLIPQQYVHEQPTVGEGQLLPTSPPLPPGPQGYISDWSTVGAKRSLVEDPANRSKRNCQYCIATGECKFGARCVCNHPHERQAPIHVATVQTEEGVPNRADALSDATATLDSVGAVSKTLSALVTESANRKMVPPATLNSSGYPLRQNKGVCWKYVRVGSCRFGSSCRYNHPEYNYPKEIPPGARPVLPIVPAQNFHMSTGPTMTYTTEYTGTMMNYVHPQRPGGRECSHYDLEPGEVYTEPGESSFGASTQLHHGFNRQPSIPQDIPNRAFAGLPRREFWGVPRGVCARYLTTGACKFGSTCRYYHPR